jgi:uncharacterized protein YjhX (UPF0386 family)
MVKKAPNKIKALLIAAIFAAAIIYMIPGKVKIDNVACVSQFGKCRSETDVFLSSLKGQGLRTVKRNLKNELDRNNYVEKYNYRYYFPSAIQVNVVERKAVFALQKEEEFALVDSSGYVLGLAENSSLPYIVLDKDLPAVGSLLERETINSLEILADLNRLYNIFIAKQENGSLAANVDGYNLIYPQQGERERLIGATVLILTKLKKGELVQSEGGGVYEIDLRFNNPVIRTAL